MRKHTEGTLYNAILHTQGHRREVHLTILQRILFDTTGQRGAEVVGRPVRGEINGGGSRRY